MQPNQDLICSKLSWE